MSLPCDHPRPKLDLPGFTPQRLPWQPPTFLPTGSLADLARALSEQFRGVYAALQQIGQRRAVVPLLEDIDARAGQVIVGVGNGQTIRLPQGADGELGQVGIVLTDVTSPVTVVNPDGTTQTLGQAGAYDFTSGLPEVYQTNPGGAAVADMAGLSVLGRSTASSGPAAAITATDANQVLASSSDGTTIGWRSALSQQWTDTLGAGTVNYALPSGFNHQDTLALTITGDVTLSTITLFGGDPAPDGFIVNLALRDQSGGSAPGWSLTLPDNGTEGSFRTPGQVQGTTPGPSYVMRSEEEGAILVMVRPPSLTGTWRLLAGTAAQAISGFVDVSAGNGATRIATSAEPIVTYSASSNMSAERVLSSGSGTTINTATAGQIKVDLSSQAADTFVGRIAGSGIPAAQLLSDIDSTSIVYDATTHTFQRSSLSGAIFASQNGTVTQFSGIYGNGTIASSTRVGLNFVNGTRTTAALSDDAVNGRIDVTVSLAAGAAESFLGNFTAGSAVADYRAGSSVAGAGLTYTAGGTLAVGSSTSIIVNADDVQRAALTGDVTASQNSNTTTIANDAVTNAKLANMASPSLKGRTTATTGDPEDLTLVNSTSITWNTATGGSISTERAALTGDVTASANSNATTIANNAVTDAKFRQSAGLSVVGRSANTTGNVADITATAARQVAGVNAAGTALAWGEPCQLFNSALASQGDFYAYRALDGTHTTSAATVTTRGANVSWSVNLTTLVPAIDSTSVVANSTVLERAALTGAVAASQNSNATVFSGIRANGSATTDRTNINLLDGTRTTATVTDDSVNDEIEVKWDFNGVGIYEPDLSTFVKNALDMAPLSSTSIIGDAVNSGGVGAGFRYERAALTGDVTASQNSNATTIANSAVTLAKMANMGQNRLLGRAQLAGTGPPTEVTPAEIVDIIDGQDVTWLGNIVFALPIRFTGILTSTMSGQLNNLATSAVSIVRLSAASQQNLTGMVAAGGGHLLILMNVGAAGVRIVDESDATNGTASTAANRFNLFSSTSQVLATRGAIFFVYDGTSSRWRSAS